MANPCVIYIFLYSWPQICDSRAIWPSVAMENSFMFTLIIFVVDKQFRYVICVNLQSFEM